jgi:transposase InsO family protein
MIAFIDDHHAAYGLEPQSGSRPICRVLRIAPSTYHAHVVQRADPAKASPRARQDLVLMAQIGRVHEANFGDYGARKVWRQLGREGIAVARCTVERLLRQMGLRGAVRGKETRTTIADKASPCPADKVNRRFRAPQPNALWVSDLTYVATWQGFV